MLTILIIIPAYNEEKTIQQVVASIKDFGQVVVVDDCSTDLTKEQAAKAGAIVLTHLVNRGQGAALQTGTNYALNQGADVVVHFDADGQHSPQEIVKMIEPILSGKADVVLGSRFLNNDSKIPSIRRLVLKLAVIFTRLFSGIKVTDAHNGFRALSRTAAQKINITQDRMAHASEILDEIVKHNLKYLELPVQISYTAYSVKKGQSSLAFVGILKELMLGKLFK